MVDVYLRSVPSDSNRADVRLYDPTTGDSSSGVTVDVAGVAVAVALGTLLATGAALFSLAGVQATSAVGTTTATAGATAAPSGVASTSAVGTVTAIGAAVVTPAGVDATSAVGTITPTGAAVVAQAGVSANSAVGSAPATGAAVSAPAGLEAVSWVGNVTVSVDAADAEATPAGVACVAALGDLVAVMESLPSGPSFWAPTLTRRSTPPSVSDTVAISVGGAAAGAVGRLVVAIAPAQLVEESIAVWWSRR